MTWEQLYAQPARGGAQKFSYGTDPLNYAELWLPAGGSASATVLMVHGGCWQTDIATCSIMQWAAHDLCTRGIAVWNIEYRGVDRSGGGYPGTFLDVATAADHLRDVAPAHGLRMDRVVAMGHSAGGHLALWLAGRPGLPRHSVLHRPDPLPIHAVIASGALPDLDAALRLPGNVCGSTGVPRLVGVPSPGRSDVYADTSATSLLPIPADVRLVYGARDEIAPTSLGRAFAACGTAVGQNVRLVEVAEEGHVELIVPGTAAWQAQLSELFAVLA